ncbi:TRAP transporter small permease [Draconibacterium sp.]|nr:TRAP transporter small permease [Draconibacterium sp.]
MILKTINKLLGLGTFLSTIGFIGSTVIQIFARFFLASAPSWTEEASRLFFIYAMSFAAGLALRDKYFVELDVFYRKFSKKIKFIVDLLIQLCTVLLFAIMGFYSIQYIQLGSTETSPSMRIPMSFAFVSILIMSVTVIIYASVEIIHLNKKRK